MSATFSEADLCAAFIAAATAPCPNPQAPRWSAYPETAGFDILLVRQGDGCQIGIEAKLALNPHVVAQALPSRERWYCGAVGPDYRAVLVPSEKVQNHMTRLCAALGVTVIALHTDPPPGGGRWGMPFSPYLPSESIYGSSADDWHEWAPATRCAIPDYMPDVIAGASAPVALTAWKVKAIRLAVLLDSRPVARADFKHLQLSPTNWMCPGGWLDRAPAGWIRSARMPDFRAQHPRNYAEIAADIARWAPAELPLLAPTAPRDPSLAPVGGSR